MCVKRGSDASSNIGDVRRRTDGGENEEDLK